MSRKHGHSHGNCGRPTRTYKIWQAMRDRVLNPNSARYADYGGRGIKIDPRWSDFRCFLKDMGLAPVGLTIERKNNDGDYTLSNCEWATYTVQNRNRRYVKLSVPLAVEIRRLYAAGDTSFPKLAKKYGVSLSHVQRVVAGVVWK